MDRPPGVCCACTARGSCPATGRRMDRRAWLKPGAATRMSARVRAGCNSWRFNGRASRASPVATSSTACAGPDCGSQRDGHDDHPVWTMTSPPSLASLRRELVALNDPAKAAFLQGFFKTAPGQYGHGDRFRGITVPVLRNLAKTWRHLSLEDAAALLESEWHEDRLAALFLLMA